MSPAGKLPVHSNGSSSSSCCDAVQRPDCPKTHQNTPFSSFSFSGETKDYVFPNNRPVFGWYHDHALHYTAENAYNGLAGAYIMSAKTKDGGCGEPWNLEDIEERLMMISDKVLDAGCQLFADRAGAHKDDL